MDILCRAVVDVPLSKVHNVLKLRLTKEVCKAVQITCSKMAARDDEQQLQCTHWIREFTFRKMYILHNFNGYFIVRVNHAALAFSSLFWTQNMQC